jgi:hypothetical protein
MGCMMRVYARKSVVLLLWSLVADEVLARYSEESLYARSFTDYLASLIMGNFPSTVSELVHMVRGLCRSGNSLSERFVEPTLLSSTAYYWVGKGSRGYPGSMAYSCVLYDCHNKR